MAGSSLDSTGLRVNVAMFGWRMDGREGIGAVRAVLRDEPPAAA